MSNSFIIELVSNASMDLYKDNTLSAFTNFLPEQFNLKGPWEVALLEIGLPTQIFNIFEGEFEYTYKDSMSRAFYQLNVPKGKYESVEEIGDAMSKAIREGSERNPFWSSYGKQITFDNDRIKLELNKDNGRCTYDFPHGHQSRDVDKPLESIWIKSYDLYSVLGDSQRIVMSNLYYNIDPLRDYTLPLPVDFQLVHSVMIYTDIVDHSIIGDTQAPILRTIPFVAYDKNDNNQLLTTMTFTKPLQYRSLLKTSFHSIRIELRQPSGHFVPFTGVGVTRLTLLFRQKEERK